MAINIQYRAADGATLIAGGVFDYGQIVSNPSAEVDSAMVKICAENIGSRSLGNTAGFVALLLKILQVGVNDGWSMLDSALDPNGTLSKPWGLGVDGLGALTGAPTAVLSGSSGSFAATGLKGAVVTAVNGTGETIASVEVTFNVGALTDEWTIDWEDVPGASTYNYYRTDVPGVYGATTLVASGLGVSTYTDSGAAAGAGTPPADNTTGGAGPDYGTFPALIDFDQSDKTIATTPDGFAVGQQWFFYIILEIPAGKTSTGNKRLARLKPTEV
jgi:hypothetical protein